MDDKIFYDDIDIKDNLGKCVICDTKLTEDNVYKMSKRPICKSCVNELINSKKEEKKLKLKNNLNKIKNAKVLAIIASAAVFVLTAIILLCYFTIPVTVKMEDAKESYKTAKYETFNREEFTMQIHMIVEDFEYGGTISFNKDGFYRKYYEREGVDQYETCEYVSITDREKYWWKETGEDGIYEEEAYWDTIKTSEIKEARRSYKSGFDYFFDVNWNDLVKSYKRGGVTTLIFDGEIEGEPSTTTIKFEKKFIKSIEIEVFGEEEGAIVITFKKKYEKISLNREFERYVEKTN